MAYNSSTGIITAPVSIRDVQNALGSSSADLGTLIANGVINKWARYKPVIAANKVSRLMYSDFSNAKFGLSPQLNTLLKSKSDMSTDSSVVSSADELEQIMTANREWEYLRPTGGMASPYRLTDFYAPSDKDSSYGYYKDTGAPISNVSSMNLKMTDIRACINNGNITITPKTSSSLEDWIVNDSNPVAPYYNDLAFRYGEGTYELVNDAGTRVIILPDLLGMSARDSWRLAVAMQVPAGASLSYMRFFVSKNTFYQSQGVNNAAAMLLPSIATNQFLCQKILDYCNYLYNGGVSGTDVIGNRQLTADQPSFSLPACLCITKEMYINLDNGLTHCMAKSASSIYSAPAELTNVTITIVDDIHFSGQSLAYDYLSIYAQRTEQYAQFGEETYTRKYIYNLMAVQKVKVATTISYVVTYNYVTGFNGTTPTTVTQTIYGTFELSSSELKSKFLMAGPDLRIVSKTQEIV